jgi:hypothetical protein
VVLKLIKKDNWVKFKPCSSSFSNLIRSAIKPVSYRKFENETGYWFVHKDQLLSLIGLSKKFYESVDTSETPAEWLMVKNEKQTEIDSPYSKLFLTHKAPIELVKLVYEKLVTTYHPDHNEGVGDSERLQEVIKAYREICRSKL